MGTISKKPLKRVKVSGYKFLHRKQEEPASEQKLTHLTLDDVTCSEAVTTLADPETHTEEPKKKKRGKKTKKTKED